MAKIYIEKLRIRNSLNRPAWSQMSTTGGLDAHQFMMGKYGLRRIKKLYALRDFERR